MATDVKVISAGDVTMTVEDRAFTPCPAASVEVPPAGQMQVSGSFSFVADVVADGETGDGISELFKAVSGGDVPYSSWSASSTPWAIPPVFRLTFRNHRGPIAYAVARGGRHVATRRRLGNAERLARQCGGYVVPIGGGLEWWQPARLGGMKTAGDITSVEFDAVGKPRWGMG